MNFSPLTINRMIYIRTITLIFIVSLMFHACSEEETTTQPADQVPEEVLVALENAGYNVFDFVPIQFEDGYLVEGDIYISSFELNNLQSGTRLPVEEQYSTNNLVNTGGLRTIKVYMPVEGSGGGGGRGKKGGGGGGGGGFSAGMSAGLDMAIARYNAENLSLIFQRLTSSSNADIIFTRLNKRDESRGILGSAGFPTASGDPYDEIKMSGVLESSYGLSTEGIATIIAHEIGHCIGFRHTDYFDRSISCGGRTSNEGAAGIGANHIPGTPTGASLADKSWMLACTNGGDRPFNSDDRTALDYLY
jgi:hypothetical protein